MVNDIFQFAQIDKNHYYIVRLNENLNLHTQDGLHIFSSNGTCAEMNDDMLGFNLPEEEWFDDDLEDEFHYNYFNELNAARSLSVAPNRFLHIFQDDCRMADPPFVSILSQMEKSSYAGRSR